MINLAVSAVFLLCYGVILHTEAKPTGQSTGHKEEIDSYAIVPSKQQKIPETDFPSNSELNLDIVPPSVLKSSSPHIYYMNSAGMAEPAEAEEIPQRRLFRKRDVSDSINNQVVPVVSGETMRTDETVIIGPPSGRPFGYSAVNLGFRPAHASYSRRWHKYPWNYH